MEEIFARSRAQWRKWLKEHGRSAKSVRLIIYHKESTTPSVHFSEAIEEALCFGWIDSKGNKRDDESFYLVFTPRNPKSAWGKGSRERAQRLIDAGLMTPAGQALIDHAKRTGTWDVLAEAQEGTIPPDLQVRFDGNAAAYKNFQGFPPSSRRLILEWIARAKRPETRQRRIAQTVELAARNIRANHGEPRSAG